MLKTIMMYDCKVCGLSKIKIAIPIRETPDIDIKDYINNTVMVHMIKDHFSRSPHCISQHLDIYLPAGKEISYLGGPPEN